MNPPRKPRFPLAPEVWLEHAASDLKLGNLGRDHEVLPEQLCFHAQQATEKALKAVLVSKELEFPLTHDLAALLHILRGSGIALPKTMDDIDELTPYAVETRYPGVWGAHHRLRRGSSVQAGRGCPSMGCGVDPPKSKG